MHFATERLFYEENCEMSNAFQPNDHSRKLVTSVASVESRVPVLEPSNTHHVEELKHVKFVVGKVLPLACPNTKILYSKKWLRYPRWAKVMVTSWWPTCHEFEPPVSLSMHVKSGVVWKFKGVSAWMSSSSLEIRLFLGGRGSLVVKVSDRGWFVTSSSPVPLKIHRVAQQCTLNLSRAETSYHWCGVV
ncbi:hypothetical protein TNCV_2722411 [Trichonephila clavipes]|nr:hypothetical protein TNCV_2722411 [Trichonephila clavipes]